MPLKGTQLDELLSGYLDDRLTEPEALELRQILKDDPSARQRLDRFQELRSALHALRVERQRGAPGLPSDFSARVMAAALKRRESQMHTPPPASGGAAPHQRLWLIAGAGLAIAASLALVFSLPNRSPSPDRQMELAESRDAMQADSLPGPLVPEHTGLAHSDSEAGRATESVQYASRWREEWNKQLLFTLVVDMTLSPEAVRSDYLTSVFAANSIALETPIVADDPLLEVLSEARMSEAGEPHDKKELRDALIYFVHADTLVVDKLLRVFMDDQANVPVLRTDLAFDTPVNQLMKRIIDSAEGGLVLDESFAAPVADAGSGLPARFPGIRPQGKLVSSAGRSQAAPSPSALTAAALDAKSTFLLLVRMPR